METPQSALQSRLRRMLPRNKELPAKGVEIGTGALSGHLRDSGPGKPKIGR